MKKNIPLCVPYLTGDEWPAVKKCFETNWVSTAGPDIDRFARMFAEYTASPYAVPVQSGTAAIHLALLALGVGAGDTVLVSSLTFIASVNPIVYCHALPVFIDSEPETFNMDPVKLQAKVKDLAERNRKPKALILVHLYGHAAQLEPVMEICSRYDIKLIEDATETLGTKYKGRLVGTFGEIGCYSFNGNKMITTGGGGMTVTADKTIAEKIKYYSTQAKDDPYNYVHNEIGYNYRMSNIQAAFGLAQLKHIDKIIAKKKKIAEWYRKTLADVAGLRLNPELSWCDNCFWLYCILINAEEYGMDSKKLLQVLNAGGVGARPFWKPIHTMPMYKDCDKTDMSIAMKIWEEGINLPSSVDLTYNDIKYISKIIQTKGKVII